jgi:glyoxalase family protein
MALLGIHHITAVCSNAKQTVEFYTKVLGLKLVKRTVNFDDPGSHHLYFGDETGKPGTLITFFEWGNLPHGAWGIGGTHHIAFIVESYDAQLRWKRWLTDHGHHITGPYNRNYFSSIYFTDPDGLILEIATRLPGWTGDEPAAELGTHLIEPVREVTRAGRDEEAIKLITSAEPVSAISNEMRLSGLHHITAISSNIEATTEFYTKTLGMRVMKKTKNYDDPIAPHYYFGVDEGKPGTIVTYFGYDERSMRQAKMGTGITHHFAFAVETEEEQQEWRIRLAKADVPVTPVMERVYFKSIYFQDPDGHILEIATVPPGFLIDETPESLGTALKLPKWIEKNRAEIEAQLSPL